jgi:acyl-CoA thioesterase FadM
VLTPSRDPFNFDLWQVDPAHALFLDWALAVIPVDITGGLQARLVHVRERLVMTVERSYWVDLRIRDMDPFGHVHYGEYLSIVGEARMNWLVDSGIDHPEDNVVAHVEVDYLDSARLSDRKVRVVVQLLRLGTTSLRFKEAVFGAEDRPLVHVEAVIVRFDPTTRTVKPWSATERELLERHGDAGNLDAST